MYNRFMENESGEVQFDPTTEKPALPAVIAEGAKPDDAGGMDTNQRNAVIIAIVVALVLLAVTIGGVVFLLQPTTDTAKIRDTFIIFMALQSVLMGVALIVLIIQVSRLIILLQNEIKPILDSTNETVNSLRGTTIFLSDNLVEPVMKMNEYFSGFSQLIGVIGLGKKARKNSSR